MWLTRSLPTFLSLVTANTHVSGIIFSCKKQNPFHPIYTEEECIKGYEATLKLRRKARDIWPADYIARKNNPTIYQLNAPVRLHCHPHSPTVCTAHGERGTGPSQCVCVWLLKARCLFFVSISINSLHVTYSHHSPLNWLPGGFSPTCILNLMESRKAFLSSIWEWSIIKWEILIITWIKYCWHAEFFFLVVWLTKLSRFMIRYSSCMANSQLFKLYCA